MRRRRIISGIISLNSSKMTHYNHCIFIKNGATELLKIDLLDIPVEIWQINDPLFKEAIETWGVDDFDDHIENIIKGQYNPDEMYAVMGASNEELAEDSYPAQLVAMLQVVFPSDLQPAGQLIIQTDHKEDGQENITRGPITMWSYYGKELNDVILECSLPNWVRTWQVRGGNSYLVTRVC